MTDSKLKISTEVLKSEALNLLAARLSATTTIEETRGVALIQMRALLDIIYPDPTPSIPAHHIEKQPI